MRRVKFQPQEKQRRLELKRYFELKAAFPDELKFVFSAFDRCLTVEEARAEYVKAANECVEGKDSGIGRNSIIEGEVRPLQQDQDMENNIYKMLKNGGCDAKTIVTKYNKQSIEELASMLIEEMMMSWVGNIINILDSHNEVGGCRGAFKGALLRLLREARAEQK